MAVARLGFPPDNIGMTPPTHRLDAELVRRGLYASRARAQAAIEAGRVMVDGRTAAKASDKVTEASLITAEPDHPWVSRGGLKLDHGLGAFGVDPTAKPCLDVGASTGGFTDVLLAHGARLVFAVDVGKGQLVDRLRADPRVVSLEETDARTLDARLIPEAPALVVCDASFIGLAKVLPAALKLAAPDADLVALFKPQFEVGPAYVGKGGIVRDANAIARAADAIAAWLSREGWRVVGWTDSPITGGDGNAERLLHARRA